jgi:hypothetical protein
VPTWASALDLPLTILTLYLNHPSPLNKNSHLKKSRHVHSHHLRQVEDQRCLHAAGEVYARHFP